MFYQKIHILEKTNNTIEDISIELDNHKGDITDKFGKNNNQFKNLYLNDRKTNLDNNKSFSNKINKSIEKNSDNENFIIHNLEKELKEKNEEIKLIKKNFIEKIDRVENENTSILNNLEEEFNKVIINMKKNYKDNVNGLEINALGIKNIYDDFIAKLNSNIINLQNNTVDAQKHDKIIKELKTKSFIKSEEEKNNYDEKLKELLDYFDKPDYRKLINNINFYLKFKDKFNFTNDDLNYIENLNFTDKEYELWMDRIKLNLITAECDYINGVMNIENEYKSLYEKIKYKVEDKLQNIEIEINEKFDVSFIFKIFFILLLIFIIY